VQPQFGICHLSINFETINHLFMRRFLTLGILLTAFFFANAQPAAETQDVLKLKESEHNFGQIPQGKPVYYTFEIVNTGAQALKLDDVHASCGCTTPEWSREPIAPGATAKIKVGYNAAAENYFEKSITITYNTNQTKQLKISGTVWKAPEGAAPANASVQFLKKQTL
jgi:Protein of unknown function (DUF1573)